jgi:hypothetical protein
MADEEHLEIIRQARTLGVMAVVGVLAQRSHGE